MQTFDAIDQRLTDLEIKASFSEDLLDELNQVIIRQQQQIDALMRELTQLRQQIPEAGSGVFSRAGDDLPPHY
ncbi:MAG: SlyX family protein [Polaromonas sp.]